MSETHGDVARMQNKSCLYLLSYSPGGSMRREVGCGPPFGAKGDRSGSAMVVSYRLSILTIALSLTIRPQFSIACLPRSN